MATTISGELAMRFVGKMQEILRSRTPLLKYMNLDALAAPANPLSKILVQVPGLKVATERTPGPFPPAPSDTVIGSQEVMLGNIEGSDFGFTSNEVQKHNLIEAKAKEMTACADALIRKANDSLWSCVKNVPYFSGTAGTSFFASDAKGLNRVNKELFKRKVSVENNPDLRCVLYADEYENLIGCEEMRFANRYGSAQPAHEGVIPLVGGFPIHRDQQSPLHTAGSITGSVGASTNSVAVKVGTTPVIGATALECTTAASSGACALKAGDVVTIAGNPYALTSDAVQATAGGDVVLNLNRGLVAAPAAGDAVKLATGWGTSYQSLAGDMTGISVAWRLPVIDFGDGAKALGDHYEVIDEVTGIPFMMSFYPQYLGYKCEVTALWGMKVTHAEKLQRIVGLAA